MTKGDAHTAFADGGSTSSGIVAPASGPETSRGYLWRPVAIGGGGFITGYSTDLAGRTRVVRTDVYGAYVWREDLDRWVQLVNAASMPADDRQALRVHEGVFEAVVAPSKPDRIYMAISGTVYRSDDRGASFRKLAIGPFAFDPNSEFRHYGPFIAVSPRNPDLLFFGTPKDGLWRSSDAGASWTKVEAAPPVADLRPRKPDVQGPGVLAWFAPNGDLWIASAGSPPLVSSDGGKSFRPAASEPGEAPRTLKQGAFAADGTFFGVDQEQKQVWRLAPDRRQWARLAQNPGLQPGAFASVAIHPRDGRIFVSDEGGRLHVSADQGESWRRVLRRVSVGAAGRSGVGEPPWLRVADKGYVPTAQIVFDPAAPDRLWSAAGTGVYRAEAPKGVLMIDWTSQTRGIEELVASDVIAPPGQAPLFAAWDFGVHRKADLTQYSTGYGPKERVLIAVQQVDWSASDPAFLVTNASDTRSCCSEDGDSVLAGYSTDAGRSWTKFPTLPQPPGTRPDDPWRMSFGTIAVASNDTNNIVWAPAYNRSPFYTKDRGKTWSRVVLAGERLPFTGSYPARHMPRRTLAADRVLPGVFYLYHSGEGDNAALKGLWKTTDGGADWRLVHPGEVARDSGYATKLRAVPGQAGHLFLTANGGNDTLKRSQDGGATWTDVAGVTGVHDVAFGKAAKGGGYPTLYLAGFVQGAYGVWRSTDQAGSWTLIGRFPVGSLDEVVSIDADKDVFGRVYLGFKGSGWRFGQPADCKPATYRFGDDQECVALTP